MRNMNGALSRVAGLLAVAGCICLGQGTSTISLSGNASLVGSANFAVVGNGSVGSLGSAVFSAAGNLSAATLSGSSTAPILGTFTLIFQSGDVLVGTFSIPAGILIPFIGGSSSATGAIAITGGTGKLAGATGSFSASGSGTATGQTTSSIQLSGNGTLNLPSSSAVQEILPQFAFGGGWYSALYFSNTSASPVSFPVNFTADNATPLMVPSAGGSSTTLSLAAGGTAIIEAPNSGPLNQGYVSVSLPNGVVGYGVFRQSIPGIADQEAVVPLSSTSATSATLLWDDTKYTTAVAMVNPSSVATFVSITVRDSSGNVLGTSMVPLLAKSKTETVLRNLSGLAAMAGARGSAEFTVTSGNVAVLGLRFDGSAFTSIPTVEQ